MIDDNVNDKILFLIECESIDDTENGMLIFDIVR